MAESRKQMKKTEDYDGMRYSSKLREKDSNPITSNKNILIGQSPNRPKKINFPTKLYINLILLISIASLINCQRELRSNSSFIILKLNRSDYFLNASFLPLPDQVFIDNEELTDRSKWEGKYININNRD